MFAVLGAAAALVLVGVALLHRTPLDTISGGRGPFHGQGTALAIPVVLGALASMLLIGRRKRS